VIVAVGAGLDGAAGIDVVPTPPDGSATRLLDLVRFTPDGPEALLLVRDAGDGVMERAADVAAAALRDEAAVVRAVRSASTRFAALVSVLGELHRFLPIGVLAPAIGIVDAALSTTACVDSVARLESPTPSIADHALSHLPRRRFLVLPDRVLRSARPATSVAHAVGAGPCFAASSRDPTGQDWRRELITSAGGSDVVTVWDRTRPWWRCHRWAEITTVGEPIATLMDGLGRLLPVAECRWCGRQSTTAAPCCFCGAAAGRTRAAELAQPGVRS
jgi:hypothetical protein